MKREETFFTKPVNLYYMLLGSSLALSLLGLIMVFSASSIYSLGSRGTTRSALGPHQSIYKIWKKVNYI